MPIAPNKLSDYFQISPDIDGSCQFKVANQSKHPSALFALYFAIIWNLVIFLAILIALGFISVDEASFISKNPMLNFLSLIPGFAIGIFFLHGALWPYYGIEEWRVCRNKIKIYRRWKFLPGKKFVQYTNCAFQIRHNMGERRSGEDESWDLMIVTVQGQRVFGKHVLYQVNRGYGNLVIMQEVTLLLSKLTGWSVVSD